MNKYIEDNDENERKYKMLKVKVLKITINY